MRNLFTAISAASLGILVGCGDLCLFKDSCESDCTTDEDGFTTCPETTWDDELDAGVPPILDALADSTTGTGCTDPVGNGDNIWFCAAVGVLTHKVQTFGAGNTAIPTDFAAVYALVSDTYEAAQTAGSATIAPTGSCPDTLTTNDVFDVRWCDQGSEDSTLNRIYAMNEVQTDKYAVLAGDSRANVGVWIEVALQGSSVTSQGDDIWFATFWSLNHFRTASALRFQNDAGEQVVVVRGLRLRAEWNEAAAQALGLTPTTASQLIMNFVDDPLYESRPDPSLQIRLRFSRVDFADYSNGAASWPGASPKVFPSSTACSTAAYPWHACKNSSGPLAIIDPVVDESDESSDDELDEVAAFVAAAHEDAWTIVFDGDSF